MQFRPIQPIDPVGRGAPDDRRLLEGYAHLLEESGEYRVLRRLAPKVSPPFRAPNTRTAVFVDVEVDPDTGHVIEMAAVPFQYAASGRVIAVHEPVVQAREPSRPTGSGRTSPVGPGGETPAREVDASAFVALAARASLAVAHNAAFDRPVVEALLPAFALIPWACSLRDVPWTTDRSRILKLPSLAAANGFFYDCHHARDDCLAAIELLSRPLRHGGGPAMRSLLDRAGRETTRIWAVGAPYERKDVLRRRGYRWSNGADGRPRAWFVEVDAEARDSEMRFLRAEVFGRDLDLPTDRVTAYERYSARG